jgi:hypothetical protein
MDEKEVEAYRKGFMEALDIKQNNFCSIFGVPVHEVLDILQRNKSEFTTLFHKRQYKSYGDVRITEWPEGLTLWIGGKLVWKSWENK